MAAEEAGLTKSSQHWLLGRAAAVDTSSERHPYGIELQRRGKHVTVTFVGGACLLTEPPGQRGKSA